MRTRGRQPHGKFFKSGYVLKRNAVQVLWLSDTGLGFSANCSSLLLEFLVRVALSRNILNLESPLIFLRKVYTSNLGFYNYILDYQKGY